MKVTHENEIMAYRTLAKLSRGTARAAVSLKLFRLKKQLQDAVDFVGEEEQKLVDRLGGKVTEEGQIIFADPAKTEEYKRNIMDVYRMEVDAPEKVKIRAVDLPDLSMQDLEALDNFIDFE